VWNAKKMGKKDSSGAMGGTSVSLDFLAALDINKPQCIPRQKCMHFPPHSRPCLRGVVCAGEAYGLTMDRDSCGTIFISFCVTKRVCMHAWVWMSDARPVWMNSKLLCLLW
jgi:hypothetical protein